MSNYSRLANVSKQYTRQGRPRRYTDASIEEFAASHKQRTSEPVAFSYVETEYYQFNLNKFLADCVANKIDTFCKELRFTIIPNVMELVKSALQCVPNCTYTISTLSSRQFEVICSEGIVSVRTNSTSTTIELTGTQPFIDKTGEYLLSKHDEIATSVEWVISGDGNSITIPLHSPRGVGDSSYPFIEGGVDAFIDDFLASTETVLLLIGEPGTGKSSFIKYLIARSEKNAIITYDPEIMKKDMLFSMFLEGNASTLILEDADAFLSARTDGNEYMSRFLNLGSGIISMPNKKLIFSTNLPNLDDVDKALLRPGRARAVIKFRNLDFNETVAFCKDHDITDWFPEPGDTHSLAELYNRGSKHARSVESKRSVGFY